MDKGTEKLDPVKDAGQIREWAKMRGIVGSDTRPNIGVAMTHVRLAAFGYLIPETHHSFHEIMSGAAGFPGCAHTPGDYSKIAPLDASLIQSWDPPAPLDAKVKT